MEGALNYFSNLQAPRSFRNQKHSLRTLVGTTLLASFCGIDSFSGFSEPRHIFSFAIVFHLAGHFH